MATFRNTRYTEHAPDSPNERWGAGSTSLARDFDLVDGSFQGRVQAAYDILGYALIEQASNSGGQQTNYIHRVIPMAAPALPSTTFKLPVPANANDSTTNFPPDLTNTIWAMGISNTQQLGVPTGVNVLASPVGTAAAQYNRARITVEFATVPYQIFDDATLVANGGVFSGLPDEGAALARGWPYSRYISRQITPFSRLVTIPYGVMWNVGYPGVPANTANLPKNTKVAFPYREGGANVTYTWMRVPLTGLPNVPGASGVNFTTIQNTVNTINNAKFDFAAPETLFLDSVATREYQGAFGERLADVTYNCIYLPHVSTGNNAGNNGNQQGPAAGTPLGWNYVLDIVNGALDYYLVQSAKSGGDPPYLSSDFSALFRP